MIAIILLVSLLVTTLDARLPQPGTNIIGGVQTKPHFWPWQISLRHEKSHSCGGSLINDQWILTAAHCVDATVKTNDPISNYEILLGADWSVVDKNDGNQVVMQVEKIIVHENWHGQEGGMANDIALLKMVSPVNITKYIKPVVLSEKGDDLPAGKKVILTGWGATYSEEYDEDKIYEVGGCKAKGAKLPVWCEEGVLVPLDENSGVQFYPYRMQQVTTTIIDRAVCLEPYEVLQGQPDSVMCAGEKAGGKDSCQGDSGGPMVAFRRGKRIQYGVVSFGPGCALPDSPGLYTAVAYFRDWMADNMKN